MTQQVLHKLPALYFSGWLWVLVLLCSCSVTKKLVEKTKSERTIDSIAVQAKQQELAQTLVSEFNKDEEEVVETKIIRLQFDTNTTMKQIKQETAPVLSAEIEYKVKRKRSAAVQNIQQDLIQKEELVNTAQKHTEEAVQKELVVTSKKRINWWLLAGTIGAGTILGYLILRFVKKIILV